MSWAARFIGEDEMFTANIFEDNEYVMYDAIHTLLDDADGVVTYNGISFDIPQLNRGFIEKGWNRPAPYKQIDLYKVVKKHFKFASNKLDYVCKALGIGGKVPNKGMELWKECMAGDPVAWEHMIAYNKQDVLITENLYHHLLPWIDAHPNFVLHQEKKDVSRCPKCGSEHLHKRGLSHTQTQSYQRYQCQGCFSWFRDRTTAIPVEDRKLILAEAK